MSLSKVSLFDFNGSRVHVVLLDGVAWFSARDVREVLEMGAGYASLPHLDPTEKQTVTKPTHGGIAPELFPGSVARAVLITESGLYKLVMRSDKPKAKEFQNWVTQVVLPNIRKDGGYVLGEEKLATGEMSEDEFILKAMRMMEDKVVRYRATICQQITM